MARYTYEDVIIDPNDPRVEIGKTYYFALGAQTCIDLANREVKERTLERIDTSLYNPFIGDEKDYPFIIRKKEPIYNERQAEWVKANNIKVGDKVRVIRKAENNENGWGDVWDCEYMDPLVNKVCKIVDIYDTRGMCIDCGGNIYYCFPYFVLEKVEESEFKVGDFVKEKETGLVGIITRKTEEGFSVYQNNPNAVLIFEASELEPVKAHIEHFNLSDAWERNALRGAWIRPKDGKEKDEAMIVGFHSFRGFPIDLCISCNGFLSTRDALSLWCFLDGSPCGLVVEDEQ